MFDSVSHKRRFQLLIGGLVISPFLVYWIAISDTLAAANKCVELKAQYEKAGNLDMELTQIRSKVILAGQRLGMVEGEPEVFQSELLSTVSQFCNGKSIELVNFEESQINVESGMRIETIPVTVEGGFIEAVRLIDHLESNAKVGRLVSVEYEVVKVGKSRKKVLRTTIHVQNVSSEV